jgi:hypothetical protein
VNHIGESVAFLSLVKQAFEFLAMTKPKKRIESRRIIHIISSSFHPHISISHSSYEEIPYRGASPSKLLEYGLRDER